jgi:aminoglycoside 3-N-acetyltransferase
MARAVKVAQQTAELHKRLKRRRAPSATLSARACAEAGRLVPLSLEPGFLSFEDQVSSRARRKLKKSLGMAPGWGTARWAWMLVNQARGKRTLREIMEELARWGVAVEPSDAFRLVHYLVDIGRMRLRPILERGDIVKAFRAVGVRQGMSLAAHVSLSRFGYIRGGAATIIDSLRDALGPQGTLAMPTHSPCLLGSLPYDRKRTPASTGAVPEFFRKQPGVRRSCHPTHSVAVYGPAARELLAGVRPDQAAFAREGFWGKLYERDGKVLLMCPVESATILHVGETWEAIPQAPGIVHSLDSNGRRRVHVIPNQPYHVDHFRGMVDVLIRRGLMHEAVLGEGTLRLASARRMADLSVKANRRDPLVSLGKNGRCTCAYCHALRDGVRAMEKAQR